MTRRIIVLGAMVAFALWAAYAATPRAFAQDPNRISQLQISVWPEYDRPTVLVLLDGTLPDPSNSPRQVSVLIPSSAQLLVTTFANADGSLAPEQASTSTALGDGYTRVTYTLSTSKFHVEYYDDLLRGAPDKTMEFIYKAQAPADQITLEFQQPLKAASFSTNPPTQTRRNGSDGFTYSVLQFPALPAGQTISAQVKYTKTDPNPSVSPTQAPSAPAPAAPAFGLWNSIFVLVAVVMLGIVGVIGFLLLQQRSRESVPTRAAPRNRSRRDAERAAPPIQVAAFCTQCGHGLGADDLFCPRCGTKRRIV